MRRAARTLRGAGIDTSAGDGTTVQDTLDSLAMHRPNVIPSGESSAPLGCPFGQWRTDGDLFNVAHVDSWEAHFADTMKDGKLINNWRMALIHAREAPGRVLEPLERWGARSTNRGPVSAPTGGPPL